MIRFMLIFFTKVYRNNPINNYDRIYCSIALLKLHLNPLHIINKEKQLIEIKKTFFKISYDKFYHQQITPEICY